MTRSWMKPHLGGHVLGFHAQEVHRLDLSSQHLATEVRVLLILQIEVHGAELRPEALIVASCDVTNNSLLSPLHYHTVACLKSFSLLARSTMYQEVLLYSVLQAVNLHQSKTLPC